MEVIFSSNYNFISKNIVHVFLNINFLLQDLYINGDDPVFHEIKSLEVGTYTFL